MSKRNKEELPFVNIVLTAQEMNSLDSETAELFKFYVMLSRYRDFKTGVVGERIKLNARSLKDAMTVQRRHGMLGFKPSGGSLDNWIKRLERLGLLINKGSYVFELPYSFKNESVQNKTDSISDRSQTVSQTKLENKETTINTEEKQQKSIYNDLSQTLSQTGSQTLSRVNSVGSAVDLLKVSNNEKNIITKTIGREVILPGFEKFWSAYPRKVKKKASFNVWKRMRLEGQSEMLIADVLRRVGEEIEWRDGFIPHPTTYLNQERWNDDVRSERPRQLSGGKSKQQLDDEADAHINELLNRKHSEHF